MTRFSSPVAGASSAATSSRDLLQQGAHRPGCRRQALRRVVPGLRRRRQPAARSLAARTPARPPSPASSDVYNLAADMGGMGFIENNKALCMLSVLINTHLLMAARDAGVRAVLLRLVGVRVRRGQAARRRASRALKEADAYPGDAGGRLRLGEAVQRADVPPLPRGLRPRTRASPATTTSTARTARTTAAARRRRRRSAARSIAGEARRASTRSRSGATASRRAASRTSTTASTGTQRLMAQRRRSSRSTSAATSWSRSTSSSTSSRRSPA